MGYLWVVAPYDDMSPPGARRRTKFLRNTRAQVAIPEVTRTQGDPLHRHENRFIQCLNTAEPGAELQQEVSVPRKSRRIDAMYVFDQAAPIFGPWAEMLSKRLVIVEQYSRYPTSKDLYDAALIVGQHQRQLDSEISQRVIALSEDRLRDRHGLFHVGGGRNHRALVDAVIC